MPKSQPGLFQALMQDPSKAMNVLTGDPNQIAAQNMDQKVQDQILAKQLQENPLPPAPAAPGAGSPQMPMTQALQNRPAPEPAQPMAMPDAPAAPNMDVSKMQAISQGFGKVR